MKKIRIRKVVIIFTVICIIGTIINLGYYIWLPMYLSYKWNTDFNEASSIGIIGGADGPTTIYLSSPYSHFTTIIFALLSIVGVAYLVFTKRKKDNMGSH